MSRPWPHDMEIGGIHEFYQELGGWQSVEWWCRFEALDDGRWACRYLAGVEPVDGLAGYGDTPREAFESLVNIWTFANGGEESPTMRALLPGLRASFDDDGQLIRPEQLDAERTIL